MFGFIVSNLGKPLIVRYFTKNIWNLNIIIVGTIFCELISIWGGLYKKGYQVFQLKIFLGFSRLYFLITFSLRIIYLFELWP